MYLSIRESRCQAKEVNKGGNICLQLINLKGLAIQKKKQKRIDRPTISYWQDAWRRLKKNPVAMASLVVLGLILIMVIVGPYIRGYDFVSKNVKREESGNERKSTGLELIIWDVTCSHVFGWVQEHYHYCACGNTH